MLGTRADRVMSARVALAVMVAFALLALPAGVLGQTTNQVAGSAVIRQRIALPNNAEVSFQLVDTSRADAAGIVLSEQKFTTNGKQAPFQFALAYDPSKIQQNGTYAVQGTIRYNGALQYRTTTQYRVITNGNPTSITVTLDPVSPLPNTAGSPLLLLLVAALLAVVLGIRWLRPRMIPHPTA